MERADEVFTERQIDTRFAADTGIYLRQKGRRHLHEINAARNVAAAKPPISPATPAAERDNDVASREIVFRERFVNLHDGGKLLLRLAGFKDELRRVDTRFSSEAFRRSPYIGKTFVSLTIMARLPGRTSGAIFSPRGPKCRLPQ